MVTEDVTKTRMEAREKKVDFDQVEEFIVNETVPFSEAVTTQV